ncbi:hypothetical protein K474DRAFT_1176755 [Panus rudis PR-1116 ss-1]|nr:hypothetical protein K474DRAFT_1176755 [Panus rudis PR-1116 ss-1]
MYMYALVVDLWLCIAFSCVRVASDFLDLSTWCSPHNLPRGRIGRHICSNDLSSGVLSRPRTGQYSSHDAVFFVDISMSLPKANVQRRQPGTLVYV